MASVTFDQVTKRYGGDEAAVEDFTLEVADREFLVLVGPSGCGKSTVLRMLAGLEPVTDGTISIDDRVVNDLAPRDRDIAMVFQSYALYPHKTVQDNLGFALRMRRMDKEEASSRVARAAASLGLDGLLDRKPLQLSGGQRQRVALGRAMVRSPQVFLLDEPLSNLDAQLRSQTRVELQDLHRRLQTTFVYVTHDQVEAMTMGDRIAVMRDGVLQQVASPQEIYESPANMYVAGFVGSPPMNFVPVEVADRRAQAPGLTIPLEAPVPPGSAVLGIRPEALAPGDGDAELRLTLDVNVVEMLGADKLVYGRITEATTAVARVPATTRVERGDRVPLRLDPGAIHVFEPLTGARLA